MYAQYKKRSATRTNTTGNRPQGRTKVTGTGTASVYRGRRATHRGRGGWLIPSAPKAGMGPVSNRPRKGK